MTTTGFWSYYNCLHFWTFLRPLLQNTVEDTQDRFQMMYSHLDTSRPQAMLICFGLFMELASSASEVLEPSEMWKPSLKPLARAGGVTARSMQIYVNLKIHLVLHCLSRRHLLVVGHLCRQHSSGWTSRAVCFSISLTRWTVSIPPVGGVGFPHIFVFSNEESKHRDVYQNHLMHDFLHKTVWRGSDSMQALWQGDTWGTAAPWPKSPSFC